MFINGAHYQLCCKNRVIACAVQIVLYKSGIKQALNIDYNVYKIKTIHILGVWR